MACILLLEATSVYMHCQNAYSNYQYCTHKCTSWSNKYPTFFSRLSLFVFAWAGLTQMQVVCSHIPMQSYLTHAPPTIHNTYEFKKELAGTHNCT